MTESPATWAKLEAACHLADEAMAGRPPAFRDRHLQRIIWESLTPQQRFARLRDLCALAQQLRALEPAGELDRPAPDGHS